MKLIVGLGNIGQEHEHTRHNVGFMVMDQFYKDFQTVEKTIWEDSRKFRADIAKIEWKPLHGEITKVVLAKPKTYMNNSGLSVQLLTTYYKLLTTDLWVVHDDVDLPLGSIRIRTGGSSGGHKGVQSVMDQLKSEKFVRFRLGVGHPHRASNTHIPKKSFVKDVDEFVLSTFSASEKGKVKDLIKRSSKAIQMALEDGLIPAMNKYNTK